MKRLLVFTVATGLLPLQGQEPQDTDEPVVPGVSIPGPISDGTPSPPPPLPEVPDFTVVRSQTKRIEVVEAPPMPGLPAVQGTVSMTVRKVVDPKLPELPQPPPPAAVEDPVVQARLQELAEKYQGTELLFLSATTYDHSRTVLTIYPNGRVDQKVTAWSNIDFNHFTGFALYRVTDADGTYTDFGMLMGVGNIDTERWSERLAEQGHEYDAPEIPTLPDLAAGGPAYVVTEGADSGSPALATLAQLHELYTKEGTRMRDAYVAREAELERQRAFYLANPPKPKDIVIHYWRGKRPENKGGDK